MCSQAATHLEMGWAELMPSGPTFVAEDLPNELFRVAVPELIMHPLIQGLEWNPLFPLPPFGS